MNFIMKINDFFARLMYGRYGNDSLNRFLIFVWFVELLVNFFAHSVVLYVFSVILCVVVLFRMLSKNIVRRRRENAAWYEITKRLKASLRMLLVRIRDRKVAYFFKCPKCKAPIRMPKRVGRFNVRCKKCGHVFMKEFK